MKCELCEKDVKKIEGHHLSYESEKIMMLCFRCHKLLHLLCNFDLEKLPIVLDIVKKYGNNWINGRIQYENSNYRRKCRQKTHKEWMKHHPDKVRKYNKKYALTHKEQITKYAKEYYQRPEVKEKRLAKRKR